MVATTLSREDRSSRRQGRKSPVQDLRSALQSARALMRRLRVIDFRSYEPLSPEAGVQLMSRGACGQVLSCLMESAELISGLPRLLSIEAALGAGDEPTILEDERNAARAVEGEPKPRHDRFTEELEQSVRELLSPADAQACLTPSALLAICRTLMLELRSSCTRILAVQHERSKWGMITEGEEGRRKCQHALRAGLALTSFLLNPTSAREDLFPDVPGELEGALVTRQLLMELRRDLLRMVKEAQETPDWELGIRMRDIRMRLNAVFTEPGYDFLRAADRYSLQRQRASISKWVDGIWDDNVRARELLSELVELARSFSGINHRRVLAQHDRSVVAECIDLVEAFQRQEVSDWAAVLERVSVMRYRSDDLDNCLLGGPNAERAPQIVGWLRCIKKELG